MPDLGQIKKLLAMLGVGQGVSGTAQLGSPEGLTGTPGADSSNWLKELMSPIKSKGSANLDMQKRLKEEPDMADAE